MNVPGPATFAAGFKLQAFRSASFFLELFATEPPHLRQCSATPATIPGRSTREFWQPSSVRRAIFLLESLPDGTRVRVCPHFFPLLPCRTGLRVQRSLPELTGALASFKTTLTTQRLL